MKRTYLTSWHFLLILTAVVLFLTNQSGPPTSLAQRPAPAWEVYFSPHGGATAAIVRTIDQARGSILVQAYSFTSLPIASALTRAHRRGVKVRVILDKSQRSQQHSVAQYLVSEDIPTFIDALHAIAHNKVIIIDSETVITGSFNFTKAAEDKNTENLLVIRHHELAYQYLNNWHIHLAHSMLFPLQNLIKRESQHSPTSTSRLTSTSRFSRQFPNR